MAPSRSAVGITSSAGTYRKSACGSTNRVMSHGHATRSTFAFLRVTHFIAFPLQPTTEILNGVVVFSDGLVGREGVEPPQLSRRFYSSADVGSPSFAGVRPNTD